MAYKPNSVEKQLMVSSFLEIAVGQTTDSARQYLSATRWRLEEAIQLFFAGNEGSYVPPVDYTAPSGYQNSSGLRQSDGDEVRSPLPVKRESLYGDDAALYYRNFDAEMEDPGVWDGEQVGTSTTQRYEDNLAALYRPPFSLMYQRSFEQAKVAAASEDKWLIVNVQSNKEFTSHMLNRDTWANEGVAETIKSSFIFWQVYDDTTEGMKVCTYYNVVSAPVTIAIDPITGLKMRLWSGMVHPELLLEGLVPLMDNGPRNHCFALPHKRRSKASPSPIATSMEGVIEAGKSTPEDKPRGSIESGIDDTILPQRCSYPPLPDEPKGEKSMLCRVGFRLPDGRRVDRNFLRSDPIQLMWSHCYSQLGEDKERTFRLARALPGSSTSLDYDSKVTMGESGLSNSMIYVTWV